MNRPKTWHTGVLIVCAFNFLITFFFNFRIHSLLERTLFRKCKLSTFKANQVDSVASCGKEFQHHLLSCTHNCAPLSLPWIASLARRLGNPGSQSGWQRKKLYSLFCPSGGKDSELRQLERPLAGHKGGRGFSCPSRKAVGIYTTVVDDSAGSARHFSSEQPSRGSRRCCNTLPGQEGLTDDPPRPGPWQREGGGRGSGGR